MKAKAVWRSVVALGLATFAMLDPAGAGSKGEVKGLAEFQKEAAALMDYVKGSGLGQRAFRIRDLGRSLECPPSSRPLKGQ